MSLVIAEIEAERARQVEAEGWTPEHDDKHTDFELAAAAAAYTRHVAQFFGSPNGGGYQMAVPPLVWPWEAKEWKPKDRRSDLIKAAALIVAEIERIDRAKQRTEAR